MSCPIRVLAAVFLVSVFLFSAATLEAQSTDSAVTTAGPSANAQPASSESALASPASAVQGPQPAGAASEVIQAVQLPPGVIAMVNGEPITEREWVDTLKRVAGRGVLDVMIRHKLVYQAAAKKGVTLSDEETQAEFDKAVAMMGGRDALLQRLSELGETQEDFKARVRAEALLRKMVERDVTVNDDETRRFFLEQYGRRARVQVVATQTQPDAEMVASRARAGTDFAVLAAENSIDDTSKRNNGFLQMPVTDGFFPKYYGRIVVTEPVAQMIFALKPGEISKVVGAGQDGFYVFKMVASSPAKEVNFDTVKDKVRADCLEQKLARASSAYLRQLVEQADVRPGI